MNRYESFFPSTSAVAAVCTLAVSAWLAIAGGLMLSGKPAQAALSEAAAAPARVVYSAPAVAIAPEARLIIVVEARRA